MLPESLVILACLHGPGCGPTAESYRTFNSKPFEAAEALNKAVLVQYWGPVVGYLAGHSGSIKLYQGLNLNLSQNEAELAFSVDF